jgi:LEA14-like dessication related protein
VQIAPTKPVLEELETISYVLGMSGIEIDNLQISHTLVKVKIRTENLSLAEQINEALRSIDGSNIQWRATPDLNKRGEQIEATFTGVWNTGSSS